MKDQESLELERFILNYALVATRNRTLEEAAAFINDTRYRHYDHDSLAELLRRLRKPLPVFKRESEPTERDETKAMEQAFMATKEQYAEVASALGFEGDAFFGGRIPLTYGSRFPISKGVERSHAQTDYRS